MAITDPRLELRAHMARLVRLGPQEASLVVLDAHDSLRAIETFGAVLVENGLVLQVRDLDVDGRARLLLEAELAVPGHVLDGQEGAVGDEDHVVVARCDQEAVGSFDHLGDDVLDRHGAVVRAQDALVAADHPVYIERGVHGLFDVRAVEIRLGAFGGVL